MTDMLPQTCQADVVLEQVISMGTGSFPSSGANSGRTLWTRDADRFHLYAMTAKGEIYNEDIMSW